MEELDIVVDLPVICTRGMIVFPNHEISLEEVKRRIEETIRANENSNCTLRNQ